MTHAITQDQLIEGRALRTHQDWQAASRAYYTDPAATVARLEERRAAHEDYLDDAIRSLRGELSTARNPHFKFRLTSPSPASVVAIILAEHDRLLAILKTMILKAAKLQKRGMAWDEIEGEDTVGNFYKAAYYCRVTLA